MIEALAAPEVAEGIATIVAAEGVGEHSVEAAAAETVGAASRSWRPYLAKLTTPL